MLKYVLAPLLIAAGLYLILLGFLFLAQTRLLFPGSGAGSARTLPQRSEQLELRANGALLHGIHLPPESQSRARGPVILGFGGNAWNASAAAAYLHDLYPEADVVVFHFRGYRPSGGAPSAAALLEDAPFIYDAVAQRFEGRKIVAIGFSIGSAVAARLARERELAGLILVTPFDSLQAVAERHYPWVPVGLLLRHRLQPADDLRHVSLPVAIIVAESDGLIPEASTQGLRDAVREPAFDRTIAGADHNSIYDRPEFRQAMRGALDVLLRRSAS